MTAGSELGEEHVDEPVDSSGVSGDDALASIDSGLATFSGYATRQVSTPNQGTRSGARPEYIVLHHMATTGFEAVLRMWHDGSKQGSAHYAISNSGEVVGVVPEELRAWSLSSATWDSKSITFEIANQSAGGSWPVSSAAHESTAKVVADLATRYAIPLDRAHIIGHREVYTRFGAGYATACPGGLNLDFIVNRARELKGAPPISTTPTGWALNLPDAATQARVQRALAARGRYAGPIDGALGTNGFKGIQVTISNVGYTGPIDGVIGPTGARAMQVYAQRFGDYAGPVDGVLGPNSWNNFALGLERP